MRSVDFLTTFHPEGPWVLTSIQADGKGIETQTFTEPAKAEKWIKKYEGKRNLYFSVGVPRRPLTKKALREDIKAVTWLHVDVDARAGEDLKEELERIRVLLTENCPVVQPTFVVFSGGGYQAFWKLKEPIEVNGDLRAAEEAALYNKQLEIVLGGDGCHNIDRIMRLPGTTNLPNARKVEKGRTPAIAEVHSYNPEAVYGLAQFTPAPRLQVDGVEANVRVDVGDVKRLDSVDELDKWKVPDRAKVVIVQGHHPDEVKEGDSSRSAWLFDAVCQLVRADVPDDVIFSILTDPDFGISESVLDKRPKEAEYAARQIERAKEEVEEPWLRKLNERFTVIGNLGGKCRVIEELYDGAMKRNRLTKQTFHDFRNRFSSQYIMVGKKQMTVGNFWLGHPMRKQFDYLVFSPGRTEANAYNLWQGFACRSLPGTNHEPFLAHVHDNICGGNETYYKYLIGWMARAVQHPDSIGETAVVLRGRSGTGKSFFAKQFGSIWGRHFLQVSDAKHLVGAFNAHLRDCVVLFGDEAFFAGDKKHESVLKTLVTEENMIIEHKGVDAEVTPNFIHLIMASNEDWVVPTGPTERRFFVLDVSDKHQQDHAYFGSIEKSMRNGGRENLLHQLISHDLEGFNVRRVPATKALMEQKMHSMDPMRHWWLERLTEGTILPEQEEWEQLVLCDSLVDSYISSCVRYNVPRRGSTVKLGMFLSSVCPGDFPLKKRQTHGSTRKYFYEFPTLGQLRNFWDKQYGMKTEWPVNEEEKQGSIPF